MLLPDGDCTQTGVRWNEVGDCVFDGIRGDGADNVRGTGHNGSDEHADGRELRTHFRVSPCKGLPWAGMPLTFPLITVLAS